MNNLYCISFNKDDNFIESVNVVSTSPLNALIKMLNNTDDLNVDFNSIDICLEQTDILI